MHSHDRTLVAKLGFADKDKQDPLHDWACQYLAQPEVIRKIVTPLAAKMEVRRASGVLMKMTACKPKVSHEVMICKGQGQYKTTIGFLDLLCDFEVSLTGDYAKELKLIADINAAGGRIVVYNYGSNFTLWPIRPHADPTKHAEAQGNLEAKYRAAITERFAAISELICSNDNSGHEWASGANERTRTFWYGSLAIEVKITPVPIGDALRQIRLYREHLEGHYFALVTAYPVTQDDVDTLKQSGVLHFKLGADFDAYCRRREQKQAAPSDSVEI